MSEENQEVLNEVFSQARKESEPNTKEVENLTDEYLKAIRHFESDSIALAKRETSTYKKVAIGASFIAVLSIGALTAAMPFKTVELEIIKVNETTGEVRRVRPATDAKAVSYGEKLDKHWLAQFTVARNGYEWETVQNSFNTVKLMSDPKVFGAYANYIQSENSPVETFDEDWIIKVDVETVSFLPSNSPDQVLSQVVFSRSVENGQGDPVTGYKPTRWTATLTSDYNADIKTEDEELLNPLGFRVTSYREDRVLINE